MDVNSLNKRKNLSQRPLTQQINKFGINKKNTK